MIDPNDIPAVANACADHLILNGWQRGELWASERDDDAYDGGPTCMLGAIGAVCHLTGYETIEAQPVAIAISQFLGLFKSDDEHNYLYIEWWNDWNSRTAAEVIAVFRDVAIKHTPDEMRAA